MATILPVKILAFYCLGMLAWNFLSRSTEHIYLLLPQEIWRGSIVLEVMLLAVLAAFSALAVWAHGERTRSAFAAQEPLRRLLLVKRRIRAKVTFGQSWKAFSEVNACFNCQNAKWNRY